METGKLYGIGLGPGDPELITVKARRILEDTLNIFYPKRSKGDKGISLSILSGIIGLEGKKIASLTFPMVSDANTLESAWNDAAEAICDVLKTGSDAVFITEGDPLFYSTFCYILNLFETKYPDMPVEVVPGITAFAASSARGKLPVGLGMNPVMVIPATENVELITRMIEERSGETLVLMKIRSVFDQLVELLEKSGLPFLFVERCSMPGELLISDLEELKAHKPDYFSLLIIKRG